MKQFLPISAQEIAERGWEQIDFLFISGDAYVDHPSFGPAVICRVLEAQGYKVAMLCQPRWDKAEYMAELGKPRLGVLISGGNLDSMLCRYTAAKNERSVDKYTAGGAVGQRPDHATAVYAQLVKKLWPDMPVVIGGIEASLRRFVHFDYWENKLMPSILESSGAGGLLAHLPPRAAPAPDRHYRAEALPGNRPQAVSDRPPRQFSAPAPALQEPPSPPAIPLSHRWKYAAALFPFSP